VDLGTTYCKAVVLDASGAELGVCRVATPWRRRGGVTYADPAELAGRAVAAIDGAAERAGEPKIRALGATSMGESGVLLDARGEVVAPSLAWFGGTGAAEAADLERLVSAGSFAERTGVPLEASRSVIQYAWLRRNVPAAARGVRWLSLAEWLLHWLGGRCATEASLGARTGFLELGTGAPYEEAWRWSGAPDGLVGPPEPAGLSLGTATRDGRVRDATLAAAGHDHLAAARGAGARTHSEIVVSCGTSITAVRSVTGLDPAGIRRALQAGLTVGPDLGNRGLALQGGFMGGRALEEVRKDLGLRYGSDAYTRCDQQAAAMLAAPGSGTEPTGLAPDPRAIAWADAARQTWRQAERIITTMDTIAGEPASCIVCGGWTRSLAFGTAARNGRVTAVAVREVNEPGARCAADLAAHASGSPTGQSSWTF
jgi:sugar (pentulose or hexulose) kinase